MKLTTTPGVRVPWDHPERFGGVFPMRVVAELTTAVSDSFLDANHRIGVRFGFNNTVLQHSFEEIPPEIAYRAAAVFPTVPSTEVLGVPYMTPPAPGPVAASQPFDIDPNAVDRGLLAHHDTVEALAAWVRLKGWQPLLPARGEPLYDLAWISDDVINVAEIKSTTVDNREMQLRLGLGQVIRYRQQLSGRTKKVRAWLVAENDVPDTTWASTCRDVGVQLTWPSVLP